MPVASGITRDENEMEGTTEVEDAGVTEGGG